MRTVDPFYPDDVVISGAVMQCAMLSGARDVLLLDITPVSLGIVTPEGAVASIVPRHSVMPCKKSAIFAIGHLGSTFSIRVYEGESQDPEKNFWLGSFELNGISSPSEGAAQLK